jgi:hypothetical protein
MGKDTIDILQEKLTADVRSLSLSQHEINTQTNAATHQHPAKGLRVLRCHDVRC